MIKKDDDSICNYISGSKYAVHFTVCEAKGSSGAIFAFRIGCGLVTGCESLVVRPLQVDARFLPELPDVTSPSAKTCITAVFTTMKA